MGARRIMENHMRRIHLVAPLILGLSVAAVPAYRAQAQVSIGFSINMAPPMLPVYAQPPIPEPGYIWAPGYWAYSDAGYYWVPGSWVMPPQPGLLWTPGYWGCNDAGRYIWYGGYWGPRVGFYGGVNYGYGYGGNGYDGGYWQGKHFYYNRSVNNFGNTHISNVYERNVNHDGGNRASYNGGPGGVAAQPDQQQRDYQNQHHYQPTQMQMQQEHMAAGNKQMFVNQNHGVPPIAATARPGDFSAHNVEPARNAPMTMPQHPEQNGAPQHSSNNFTPPQHPDSSAPPQYQNNMMQPQQHPQNVPAPQHQNNMMQPQQPSTAPAPQAQHSQGGQQQNHTQGQPPPQGQDHKQGQQQP